MSNDLASSFAEIKILFDLQLFVPAGRLTRIIARFNLWPVIHSAPCVALLRIQSTLIRYHAWSFCSTCVLHVSFPPLTNYTSDWASLRSPHVPRIQSSTSFDKARSNVGCGILLLYLPTVSSFLQVTRHPNDPINNEIAAWARVSRITPDWNFEQQ